MLFSVHPRLGNLPTVPLALCLIITPHACTSVEDCPQGMHLNLVFIQQKGTRRGLASLWGEFLVQLTALIPS